MPWIPAVFNAPFTSSRRNGFTMAVTSFMSASSRVRRLGVLTEVESFVLLGLVDTETRRDVDDLADDQCANERVRQHDDCGDDLVPEQGDASAEEQPFVRHCGIDGGVGEQAEQH